MSVLYPTVLSGTQNGSNIGRNYMAAAVFKQNTEIKLKTYKL